MSTSSSTASRRTTADRLFYPVASVLLLLLTVIGFKLFYFHGMAYPGRPLTPPIRTLVITHGITMSVWVLLGIIQPALVAIGKRRIHMALGRLSAVFAVVVFVLGVKVGIESTRFAPPGAMFGPLTPKQFMAVPILSAVLFAFFVAVGIAARKRPVLHRPMMFMATMTAVGAAISRIEFLNHLYAGTVFEKMFGAVFFAVVIACVFLVAKCIVSRAFDRWLAAGVGLLAFVCLLMVHGSQTAVWDSIAGFLLR